MFDNLSNLGYGIITFAIIVGVGAILLTKLQEATSSCPTGFNLNSSYGLVSGYNSSLGLCQNDTASYTNTTAASDSATATHYMGGQLGTSGLTGWVPAIIALSIGMLFLGVFLSRKGRKV